MSGRRLRRRGQSLANLARRREREQEAARVSAIKAALAQSPPDLDALRLHAPYGFVSDELRRRVWPALLGVPGPSAPEEGDGSSDESSSDDDDDDSGGGASPSAYAEQIGKDVPRSLHHFSSMRPCRKASVRVLQDSLSRVLNGIFERHPDLHYVQGFNDICSVLLLVCGESLARRLAERLALLHVRDSLRPSLETVVEVLGLIFPLVEQVDPEVHAFLAAAGVQSFFTLSWVLTWFAHNIDDMDGITRVFDFLLASHPLMPVYLAVALIVQLRGGLLRLECEYAAVHEYFQRLPSWLDVPRLVREAARLHDDYPPDMLYEKVGPRLPGDSPMHSRSADDLVRGAAETDAERRAAARRRFVRSLVPAAAFAVGAAILALTQAAIVGGGGGGPAV